MKSVNNVQLRSVHFMAHSDIAKTGFSAKHASILHMEPSIYINLNLFQRRPGTKSQLRRRFHFVHQFDPAKAALPITSSQNRFKQIRYLLFSGFRPRADSLFLFQKNRIVLIGEIAKKVQFLVCDSYCKASLILLLYFTSITFLDLPSYASEWWNTIRKANAEKEK